MTAEVLAQAAAAADRLDWEKAADLLADGPRAGGSRHSPSRALETVEGRRHGRSDREDPASGAINR